MLSAFTMLLALSSTTLLAQRTVTGTVLDEYDIGLPGVTVQVKGTGTGTATDADGNFSITVPGNESTLVFSFIGYFPKEELVGNRTTVNLSLIPDVQTLTEMVVTGYAVQEKRDITGSVGTVNREELIAVPAATVENQLQGRLAGVNVTNSGQPGAAAQVRIRGFSSFSNNNPLYVVDGVQTLDITTLNPNDIETITVLKDAGAASIYGSRASNGVILITTRRGVKGGTKVTYNAYYGSQDPGRGFDNLLNTQEMADLQWLVYDNSVDGQGQPIQTASHPQYGSYQRGVNRPIIPDYIVPSGAMEGDPRVDPSLYALDLPGGNINQIVRANKQGTRWFDEVTRAAPIQNHDITLSGGGDNSRFMVSLNYFNQQGVILETFSKRYSIRGNSEFNIGDRVRIGENLQVVYRQNRGITNQDEGNAISFAYRNQPIVPVYDIMNNFAGTRAQGTGNAANPVANLVRSQHNDAFDVRILGNLYAEVDILENLTFRTSMGGSLQNGYNHNFTYQTYERAENINTSTFSEGAYYNADWTWTNTVTYRETFDKHAITAVGGYEAIQFGIGRNVSGTRGGYFSLNPDFWTLANGATILNATSEVITPTTGVSYFGRVDYGFDDKYLLSLTLRRDGSSRFRQQFGTFPSVTAAWRISSEEFMRGSQLISDLKLRAGYGQMGNQQALNPANQFFLFGGAPNTSFYDIGGTNTTSQQGFRPTRIGNPDARWETAENINVGIDLSLFEDKLQFMVDWYRKENRDLLFAPELPGTAGAASPPAVNLANMVNSGIDAQVIYRHNFNNDVRFESNLTFTSFRNEILNIAEGQNEFFSGGSRFGDVAINRVGHPLSSFFGYQVQGIFQSNEEVANAVPQDGAAPGRFRFQHFEGVDENGDPRIGPADRVILGSPIPDFTAGLNLSLAVKNWDFTAFLFASVGNDIYNYTKWWTDFVPSFVGGKSHDLLYNSWTPERPNATTPIAEGVSNFSTNTQSNSYYIEDGSFLRARNIQVGYTFPTRISSRLKMDRLRIYAQGVNLFTITGYSGLDPELQPQNVTSGEADRAMGIDYGNYPVVKQFIFGINVGF
ncbi:hypothetical protein EL17_06380 [Anditalea andensis]|uniref:TonB-dependent receptor n=2 Tax=Anditalea andensis TaxID=1048983 RepID=A0A074KZK1_9BACT|nr:hypothetical protein EL17_06380 [Anditalea andensis]